MDKEAIRVLSVSLCVVWVLMMIMMLRKSPFTRLLCVLCVWERKRRRERSLDSEHPATAAVRLRPSVRVNIDTFSFDAAAAVYVDANWSEWAAATAISNNQSNRHLCTILNYLDDIITITVIFIILFLVCFYLPCGFNRPTAMEVDARVGEFEWKNKINFFI